MFKSIVAGTDGSDTAEVAIRRALDLARDQGARLHLVTAYGVVEGTRAPAIEAAVTPDAGAQGVLADAAGIALSEGIECELYARRESPAEAILDVAEEVDADLIVVGNKGMTGARRFLLGSVPDKISHHATCSVLIVRTIE
jgi:nucleotide-binding universal stress UspA family protein